METPANLYMLGAMSAPKTVLLRPQVDTKEPLVPIVIDTG